MIVRRTELSPHCVLAIDADMRVVEELPAVPSSELAQFVTEMRARLGKDARILIDGATADEQTLVRGPDAPSRGLTRPPVQVFKEKDGAIEKVETQGGKVSSVEFAHAMLWDTYERAARVQSWMLDQASVFTLELLNHNKRLADQAGELQSRYQTALAELDYMQREQKLLEGEAAASRLSRHLIDKARAEIMAASPTRPSDRIDDCSAVGLRGVRRRA